MANADHEEAKKYVMAVLRHYGFNVKPEYWIMDGRRRIDCAGWCADENLCGHHTVGIEISKTSDLAKDIETLSHTTFDLKFIVLLKPYEVHHIEDFFVVRLELFENTLRNVLKIPKDYPVYAAEEVNSETLKKYAVEILKKIEIDPQEVVNTLEFENIIRELLDIYQHAETLSEIAAIKEDLEEILRNRYNSPKNAGTVKEKKRKIITYEDLLPEGITDEEWDKALINIENFKSSFKAAGFPHFADRGLEILLEAYSSREILVKEVINAAPSIWNPHIVNHIPPPLYNLLEKLGYIKEYDRRGRYANGKSFFGHLTPKGMEIAKSFALKVLKDNKEFIDDQISLNGEILSFMACIADIPKGSLIGGIEVSRDPLLGYQMGENYKEIIRHVPTEKEEYVKSLLSRIWEPSDFSQNFTQRAKEIGVPLNLEIFFESSIKLPKIKKKIMDFWLFFSDKKLAFIEPHFSSRGEHYGDFIHPIPLVVDYILRKTRDKVLKKLDPQLIEELNAINVLYSLNALSNTEWKFGLKKNITLEDLLMVAGVSKEYFSEFIEELYKKGLTSKLMEEHPYLIVLDEEELQGHLVERLKDIEEKLLTAVGE